jgi:hypothetical protein
MGLMRDAMMALGRARRLEVEPIPQLPHRSQRQLDQGFRFSRACRKGNAISDSPGKASTLVPPGIRHQPIGGII